ncbi:hypothetical protein [Streptomyces sp. NPDC051567]|uniref:BACON domain-containing protein n=1 Tax=Streptomyces sp. NPDC051567 TaxID=3365660 RepID=UPI0037A02AC7
MNSSDQAHPAPRTGAHRAHGRTSPGREPSSPPPPFRHEPYLDGLFTYCLSVLCDHDTATDVLGAALAVAERHPGRCPDESDRRAWLYALARWGCLRRLAGERPTRQGAHSTRRTPEHTGPARVPGAGPVRAPAPGAVRVPGPARAPDAAPDADAVHTARADVPAPGRRTLDVSAHRRTELARLAWPEAAGTTPEQREALELAVRHRLGVPELAAVLTTSAAAARELLAGAACEVERTRAALAVVETGGCPAVSRLTGDGQVLLSATLRTELVRHVDDCPRCRRVAERTDAAAPWPGSGGVGTAALPLVAAPRTAVHAAMLRSGRGRGTAPRFDRTGFPTDPRHRLARRGRLRSRAVTTTVVATVIAAPVLALWAAYRGDPAAGGPAGGDATRISARDAGTPAPLPPDGRPLTAYENSGNASGTSRDTTLTGGVGLAPGAGPLDVSVEVTGTGLPPVPGRGDAPGRLTVAAHSRGSVTVLTLTATGGEPVHWWLRSDAPWLRASRTAGTLAPEESVTLLVSVDSAAQPVGAWTARIGVDPGGTVVSVRGHGRPAPPPSGPASPPPPSGPGGEPSPPPTGTPPPSPGPVTGPPPTEGPASPSPTPPPAPSDPPPN